MSNDEKVFGLPAEQGRWIFIVLGMVINLCLGSVYAWSVFKKPLEALFSIGATQSGLPFMVFLAFFALFVPLTGKPLDKFGPRRISILGGIIVGLGWILSKFASNITFLTITYGIVAGAGVGIVYGAPITVAARWFPDKKGLAVGLTLLGFGMSALITAPLARKLIDSIGPLNTFGMFGVAFIIITVVFALPMKFPKTGWKPAGWAPPQPASGVAGGDFTAGEMLKTSSAYGLWLCYIIGTTAGLMAIGISSACGVEVCKLDKVTCAGLVSVFAIFNGLGRPLFGWLTDKITPRNAAVLSFVIIASASAAMLTAGEGTKAIYVASFCGFWLCLGGWLAIGPTATAGFFGLKNYPLNYGIIFSAYGLGAIIGGYIAGCAKDQFGSYTVAFKPTLIMAIVGIVVAFLLLKPPKNVKG
jgi:MFS transporter, OFA family, oxalate/formate antiporter